MEALLNALACERGRYKQASEALHNAHGTILTLEAQVARREAELECRDLQHIANIKPIPRKRSLVEVLHPNLPEVPLPEVVHTLNVAEERNHVLEQEVRELHSRVSCPILSDSLSKSITGITGGGVYIFPVFHIGCSPDFASLGTRTHAFHAPLIANSSRTNETPPKERGHKCCRRPPSSRRPPLRCDQRVQKRETIHERCPRSK